MHSLLKHTLSFVLGAASSLAACVGLSYEWTQTSWPDKGFYVLLVDTPETHTVCDVLSAVGVQRLLYGNKTVEGYYARCLVHMQGHLDANGTMHRHQRPLNPFNFEQWRAWRIIEGTYAPKFIEGVCSDAEFDAPASARRDLPSSCQALKAAIEHSSP